MMVVLLAETWNPKDNDPLLLLRGDVMVQRDDHLVVLFTAGEEA